ncbi:MAG TPA: NAD(P)/FAD-dependent oxidoreductase, partial [Flavisolibacter sp.]
RSVFTKKNYPVELGAEFIHGKLPITTELLEKAGAKKHTINGSIWQSKDGQLFKQADFIEDYEELEKKFDNLKSDVSVADFLSEHLNGEQYKELRFSLQNYVEGYYAADINKASTFALREELAREDEDQHRIEGGYQKLIKFLEETCVSKGVQFYFSQQVTQLHWKENSVEAMTHTGSFSSKKVIVTVSIGVLQRDGIHFFPSLPEKKAAAMKLGFGQVVKINLLFEDAFWKDLFLTGKKNLENLNFLLSEEEIPTWWTQHPNEEPLLTGWVGGPKAALLQNLDREQLVNKAIYSLSRIFNIDVLHLQQKLIAAEYYDWAEDPHFYGAYSYEVLQGEEYMKQILTPVEQTLFFAGEGLHHGSEIGTVEAALQSGRSVAQQVTAGYFSL